MRRVALAGLLALAGCGSGDDDAPPPPQLTLRVAEQGFTQAGERVLVGAVLRNAGDRAAEGVEVTFEARDAGGEAVGSTTENLVFVPARSGFNVGTEVELEDGARAEEVDVRVEVGEEDAFAGDELPAEPPGVANVEVSRIDELLFVTAEVEGTVARFADAFAVLRDRDGEIVGGLTSVNLKEESPEGGTVLFSTDASLRGVADADVSVDAETG